MIAEPLLGLKDIPAFFLSVIYLLPYQWLAAGYDKKLIFYRSGRSDNAAVDCCLSASSFSFFFNASYALIAGNHQKIVFEVLYFSVMIPEPSRSSGTHPERSPSVISFDLVFLRRDEASKNLVPLVKLEGGKRLSLTHLDILVISSFSSK